MPRNQAEDPPIETGGAHRALNRLLAGQRILAGVRDVDGFVSAYLSPEHECWRHVAPSCPETLRSALEAVENRPRGRTGAAAYIPTRV